MENNILKIHYCFLKSEEQDYKDYNWLFAMLSFLKLLASELKFNFKNHLLVLFYLNSSPGGSLSPCLLTNLRYFGDTCKVSYASWAKP